MEAEKQILDYFFTNTDKPIFALKNIPPALQAYVYMGVSRFPDLRERFLKILKDKGAMEAVAKAIENGNDLEAALKPATEFGAEKNKDVFYTYGHKSAGEGASIFLVSEQNPIYATGAQQDFYYPMTTMELSTRYSAKFGIDRVYWDPTIMNSEFAAEAKQVIAKNFELYSNGFDILMQRLKEAGKQDLPEKVSVLDSLRFLIPIAAYTTIILGGNTRSVIEHFRKLLTYKDNYIQGYAQACLEEASKLFPEYFAEIKPMENVIKREEALKAKATELFEGKFSPVKENVTMFFDLPTEELALTQILYPHCNKTFEEIFETASGFNAHERKGIFEIAAGDRGNRENPVRGFETRPIVFEVEAPWALWKDFKRNRMNLRFQQNMRGKAGFDTPELIRESAIEKDYKEAMQQTSDLIEKIAVKYPELAKTVAAQGSRKRFLMCMAPRQLTVLCELRTCGEGDKGYRKIASKMIELAKEKKQELFAHIQDNYKKK
ncbi:MAG: FAD-dependent thymidylate synthase [Candidatus Diapherotrites archaeon]|nr:FAD-dependent thymidylate synthase [Candidatus Diapherotrites archaeon]